ncbi:MAG: elongation factor G [Planctomycetota bacterium]
MDVKDIRNIALVGHGASGKTSLVDQMLFRAKIVNRLGNVDEGTSASDFDEEEKQRQFSINSTIFHIARGEALLNVVDAPGYSDFAGAAIAPLAAVETAVLVLSAPAGIEINARKMWEHARARGLARAIVINKMDLENIQYEDLIAKIKEAFGDGCVAVNVPVGLSGGFRGVVGVFAEGEPGEGTLVDPAGAHEQLMDLIVEGDDALMERYLEGQKLSEEEILVALRKGIAQGRIVPILHASAGKGIGIDEILDFAARAFPCPSEGVARKATDEGSKEAVEIECSPTAAGPVAQVFKVMTDPFVGKLTYFRVLRGTIRAEDSVYNTRVGSSSRPAQLLKVQGAEGRGVSEVIAGDIAAVSKVEDTKVGDALTVGKSALRCPDIAFPTSMVSLAVEPKSRGDEGRISTALAKLGDEDPTFVVSRDAQTGELVVSGLSSLHLEVMLSRLARRFQVEVTTKEPKIPYRETIQGKGESRYRHKKQTGGRGQFAEVALRMEPSQRGEGFQFLDEIVGGSIPNQFIPAVEKGIREKMDRGVIAGYPVVDVTVHCWDGKYHDVDSSEAAFKLAASRAFEEAFKGARAVLLEPVVKIEVTAMAERMGDITGDLNSRRGRIQGMDSVGGMQVIKALVPMAEVMRYATELRSMTGGTASYTMEFSHYDVVPAHVQQKIVAQAKPHAEE